MPVRVCLSMGFLDRGRASRRTASFCPNAHNILMHHPRCSSSSGLPVARPHAGSSILRDLLHLVGSMFRRRMNSEGIRDRRLPDFVAKTISKSPEAKPVFTTISGTPGRKALYAPGRKRVSEFSPSRNSRHRTRLWEQDSIWSTRRK